MGWHTEHVEADGNLLSISSLAWSAAALANASAPAGILGFGDGMAGPFPSDGPKDDGPGPGNVGSNKSSPVEGLPGVAPGLGPRRSSSGFGFEGPGPSKSSPGFGFALPGLKRSSLGFAFAGPGLNKSSSGFGLAGAAFTGGAGEAPGFADGVDGVNGGGVADADDSWPKASAVAATTAKLRMARNAARNVKCRGIPHQKSNDA